MRELKNSSDNLNDNMKKLVLTFFTLLIFSFLTPLFAQDAQNSILEQAFGDDGEIYFTFSISEKSDADLLTRIISIDNVAGNDPAPGTIVPFTNSEVWWTWPPGTEERWVKSFWPQIRQLPLMPQSR